MFSCESLELLEGGETSVGVKTIKAHNNEEELSSVFIFAFFSCYFSKGFQLSIILDLSIYLFTLKLTLLFSHDRIYERFGKIIMKQDEKA